MEDKRLNWLNITQNAINFIEDNLLEDITIEDVSNHIFVSSEHFQKVFFIITGFSISEYIRNRRLSLAAWELQSTNQKVIDIALKYGYDTPESFSKAFSRFHGINPSKVSADTEKLRSFYPLTIEINIRGGFVVSRKLIPNVEKLYENGGENYMFCSCMRSAMKALNENPEFDYAFFVGVTGDLFSQTWWREPMWRYNDSYSSVCHHTEEPIRAAFDACGYEYEYICEEEIKRNKAKYIKRIVESIDKGYPVLTFGIVGPPICSIIFGYDENGDILIGWSQFTDEPKEDNPSDLVATENYFSKRNGLDESEGLIFFGKKKVTPTIADSLSKSLQAIPSLAFMKQTDELLFGEKAFEGWEASLLADEYFENEGMLSEPLDTYGSCMVLIGSNMYAVQSYLDRALVLLPDMKEYIEQLKEAYLKQAQALDKLVEFQGGFFFEADRSRLLSRDFRLELAKHVNIVKRCYIDAANIIKEK